jgi:hypothetical protein
MYYLLIGGGAIIGYNYSNNIKEWGIRQNKYISNYFKKKEFLFNLIKIEKIFFIEINNNEINKKIFINPENLENDFYKVIDYINKNKNNFYSFLMIEYKVENSNKNFRFNYPIDKNDFENKIKHFKNNFNLDENNDKKCSVIDDEYLSFLNNYQHNNIPLSIISIDYMNNDITNIIKSYSGLNSDFHTHTIDFRFLLDQNYDLIFKNNNYNLNIIKNNLDIIELNLEENNFQFISQLY